MIPEKEKLNDFCEMNKFEHLMLKPTCFKRLFPSAIDQIRKLYKIGCVWNRYRRPPQNYFLGFKKNLW